MEKKHVVLYPKPSNIDLEIAYKAKNYLELYRALRKIN